MAQSFGDYKLNTGSLPFEKLGDTSNLDKRLWNSPDPVLVARQVLPVLDGAPICNRSGAFILGLTTGRDVYHGNQAVYHLAEGLLSNRWGVHVSRTSAFMHATKHVNQISDILGPAAYSRTGRAGRNAQAIGFRDEGSRYRGYADAIEYTSTSVRGRRYSTRVRSWCAINRATFGIRASYSKRDRANYDFSSYKAKCKTASSQRVKPYQAFKTTTLPRFEQKIFTTRRDSKTKFVYLNYGPHHYFIIDEGGATHLPQKLLCLSVRDLHDLSFVLNSAGLIRTYHRRRARDIGDASLRRQYDTISNGFWCHYLLVMRSCGLQSSLQNKLGVYFDVLQWRYLAGRSGCEFYDHAHIMKMKIESKGLTRLPDQDFLLSQLRSLPMDIAVDLLGIYKASIYPQVDPFDVVAKQYELHMSRFQTDWEVGSREHTRFEQTRAYMWYLGIRVLYKKLGFWPGHIRRGVEQKPWHDVYRRYGIPADRWADAHDVDLTGAAPVADISNEQYLRQQDSACAPANPDAFLSFEAMRKAPKRQKRKLLFAVQEENLPDLPRSLEHLNQIGRSLPDGYVGKVEHTLPFSVDIVTGSRCERHKDAPRPFYAASSPWGCILSYIDGITRDFLTLVPQSLLGLSTRQKYMNIKSASVNTSASVETFYMSDDKAKYSPRMDPQSQQLPADFFAELFNIPAIKAYGPIMYHCKLFYRVCGHLVQYNANGTDREGMRGASNTWLEIVAQGLATRLCRERGLTQGKSLFLSFIDDGLRRFSIPKVPGGDQDVIRSARSVVEDVVFGLRVLGRELSWDKTFVSRDMFVILNELIYDGAHITSGLKSYCTSGDIEMKAVMTAADYEQLFFGKMRGAHGVGAPLDLCHWTYLFETLLSHYKMGVRLQDNHRVNQLEYRLFCITPIALGGGGLRSQIQLSCNEVGNATKEGIGNMIRFAINSPLIGSVVNELLVQPLEPLNPVDYMREPEQIHVGPPRIKTQRLAAEVRKQLKYLACNTMIKTYLERDDIGIELLRDMGRTFMSLPNVSAEEVRQVYATSPVAFIDDLVQKLSSSTTISLLLEKHIVLGVRHAARRDLIQSLEAIRPRSGTDILISELRKRQAMFEAVLYYMR